MKKLATKTFVAISDDLLDSQPQILARLIPYQRDYPCRRLYRQPLDEMPWPLPVRPQEGK